MIRIKDIAKHVSKELGISQADSNRVINVIFDKIKDGLLAGSDVNIYEFCTFGVKEAMGRDVVVPPTGELIKARIYKKVYAKFSTKFRDRIKN